MIKLFCKKRRLEVNYFCKEFYQRGSTNLIMGVTKSLSFLSCLLGAIEVLDFSNIKFVNTEILVIPKFISKVVLVL